MPCLDVAWAGAAGQRSLNRRDYVHQSLPCICLINGFSIRATKRDSYMLADPSEPYFPCMVTSPSVYYQVLKPEDPCPGISF